MCIRQERLKYLFKVRDSLKQLIDLKYREYEFMSAYQYVLDEIAYFTPECDLVKQEGRY
jgi:hypothetical protein